MSQSTSTAIFYLAIWCALVAWAVNVARKRGRDVTLWAFITAFFGIFGVLVLYILPPKQPSVES